MAGHKLTSLCHLLRGISSGSSPSTNFSSFVHLFLDPTSTIALKYLTILSEVVPTSSHTAWYMSYSMSSNMAGKKHHHRYQAGK